jgi:four helix bundle protein
MSFKTLEVWKRSARLSAQLYRTMSDLRDYGFRDQITRSGLSIASNIAEGYGRGGRKEIAQFLRYAKGSAAELETQIYVGMEADYIQREQGKIWAAEAIELQSMLAGLLKTLG